MNYEKHLFTFLAVLVLGCDGPNANQETAIDKSEAQAAKFDSDLQARVCRQLGKPADCDLCDLAGWYGDGECDTFCNQPDPDCTTGDSGVSCAAQEATGQGACERFFGFVWNGNTCVPMSGCWCVGADCDQLSFSPQDCEAQFLGCAPAVDAGPTGDAARDASGYDPCAGKACGERCVQCPPGEPGCIETSVIKTCNEDGECIPGEACPS